MHTNRRYALNAPLRRRRVHRLVDAVYVDAGPFASPAHRILGPALEAAFVAGRSCSLTLLSLSLLLRTYLALTVAATRRLLLLPLLNNKTRSSRLKKTSHKTHLKTHLSRRTKLLLLLTPIVALRSLFFSFPFFLPSYACDFLLTFCACECHYTTFTYIQRARLQRRRGRR